MPRPLQWILNAFDVLVVVGMTVMSLLVFSNVVLRYGFSSGIPFVVEVSRVILVWIIFLGAVVALAKGAHLSVDMLVARLPRRARFACFLVSYGLMLWCCWLLGRGSWSLTLIEWNNRVALSGIPVGLTYAAGLVAAITMALCLLVGLWRSLHGTLPRTWAGVEGTEPPLAVMPAQTSEKLHGTLPSTWAGVEGAEPPLAVVPAQASEKLHGTLPSTWAGVEGAEPPLAVIPAQTSEKMQ